MEMIPVSLKGFLDPQSRKNVYALWERIPILREQSLFWGRSVLLPDRPVYESLTQEELKWK